MICKTNFVAGSYNFSSLWRHAICNYLSTSTITSS